MRQEPSMASGAAVADVLGFERAGFGETTEASVIAQIIAGLPIASVDRLASAVAPDDRAFAFNLVARATLNRRRAEARGKLTAQEGAKVVRLARVWAMARDVWKTDAAARDFLHRAHALLENRPPLDIVLESEFGGPRVEAVLGQLKYGSAA
ncbi:MAG: DUF2384 domain-containing protein [Methylobacterium sp.]|uniref:antitoxin Xre/MbcA/ParS toxin-binding domain-containing protein n=1 Tax=Methylobacterium sp. TaxID=409 RepID=UPI002727F258|nr:antitoxin Xre/MbcA/ParS toxin-binding domain-containing protein [Methylobacterium sp.]MDO9425925.1 DUF2384 domain-containing protein [Methylobacterium sp.]